MRWILVFCILLLLTQVVDAKENLARGEYIVGDSIVLGDDIFTIIFSNSSSNILLRGSQEDEIIQYGDCYLKDPYEVCLDYFTFTEENYRIAGISTYLFIPNIFVNITYDTNETFVGKEIDVEIEMRGDPHKDSKNFSFELYIPKKFTLRKSTCEVLNEEFGYIISKKKDIFRKDKIDTCHFSITTTEPSLLSTAGKTTLIYIGDEITNSSEVLQLMFKSHLEINLSLEENNETKPFEANFSIANLDEREIDNINLEFFIPNLLYIDNFPIKLQRQNSQRIENILFQTLTDRTSLDRDEIKYYNLKLQSNDTYSGIIYVTANYEYNNKPYSLNLQKFNLTVNNSPFINCSGTDDFNISLSLNLSDKETTVYTGNTLRSRVYLQSNVHENITWANIALTRNGKLLGQKSTTFGKFYTRLVHLLEEYIPYDYEGSTYDFEVLVDYVCQKNETEYSFMEKISVPITSFDDLELIKNIEREEIRSNETIEINVTILKPKRGGFYNLRVQEIIPSEFKTRGLTFRNMLVRQNETKAYTYFLTAPEVNETTSFDFSTIMDIPLENQTIGLEYKHNIIVNPIFKLNITLNATTPFGKKYMYEPILITYEIFNNDTLLAENVVLQIEESSTFDSEVYEYEIDKLFPKNTEVVEFFIIPKDTNVTINANLAYKNQIKSLQNISTSINEAISLPRIVNPGITYSVIENINGSIREFSYSIENPTQSPANVSYFNGESYTKIILPPETVKQVIIYSDIENTLFEKSTNLVSYSFLGENFFILPENRTLQEVVIEDVLTTINKSEKNASINETQNITDINLSEPKRNYFLLILLLTVILSIVIGGAIGFEIYIHRKKSTKTPTPTITAEELEKIEKEPLQKDSAVQKNNDEKNDESSSVELSHIFTFDDYEELKKQLEEKKPKDKDQKET